jgi:hypothetical protein
MAGCYREVMGRPAGMNAAVRGAPFVARIGAALLTMLVAIGCQDTDNGLPILTDAHEIVSAAATSSAALGSVHVEIDLKGRNGDPAGGQEEIRFLLAADIDVQGRNIVGRTRMTQPGQQGNAGETTEFILLDTKVFMKDSTAPRWFVNDNAGNGDHLPANAAYLGLLETAVANGSAILGLADAVQCGEATCYHVTATLDPTATWVLLVAPLVGQKVDAGIVQPPGMPITPASLDVFVDQKTRLLAGLNGTLAIQQTGITFSMTFSNHDLPIRIAAPPPQLVENQGGGFQPAPQPQPIESP